MSWYYERFNKGSEVYHRTLGHGVVTKSGPAFSMVKFDNGDVMDVSNIMLTANPVTPPVIVRYPAEEAKAYAGQVRQVLYNIKARRMGPRTSHAAADARINTLLGEVQGLKDEVSGANRDINETRPARGVIAPFEYMAAQSRKIKALTELRVKKAQLAALATAASVKEGEVGLSPVDAFNDYLQSRSDVDQATQQPGYGQKIGRYKVARR
jgi:hypothetical protein